MIEKQMFVRSFIKIVSTDPARSVVSSATKNYTIFQVYTLKGLKRKEKTYFLVKFSSNLGQ